MSYNIQRLDFFSIKEGNYFFDSNIWLKILRPKNNPTPKEQKYIDFFEKLRKKGNAKVVVPVMVLSEVINRYLREVSMQKYILKKKLKEVGKEFYKEVFRPTPEFKIEYELLCDEIKAYHDTLTLINDGVSTDFKFKHILNSPPKGLDFNDYFYYTLCKKNDYLLVTDDKDFFVEDIQIITLNSTLLELKYSMELKSSR